MSDLKMPFLDHLEELRHRILVSLCAILVGFGLTFYFSEKILALLVFPLTRTLVVQRTPPYITAIPVPTPPKLVFLAPAEAFWMHIKVAFLAGLLLTLPVVLYQTWRFISPGLFSHEKRYALPFVVIGTIFFLLGVSFCFVLVLPFALNFLLTYKTENLTPFLSVGNYVDFTVKFLLAFGLIFELPLAITLASWMGIVTPEFLARHRKYAILINFIIAALLTPTPDIFNQSLMAVPMCLLYEVGIWASRLLRRRKRAETSATAPDTP